MVIHVGPGDPATGFSCGTCISDHFPPVLPSSQEAAHHVAHWHKKLQYQVLQARAKWAPGFSKAGSWMRYTDSPKTSHHSWSSCTLIFYVFLTLVLHKVVLIALPRSLCLLHRAGKRITSSYWQKWGRCVCVQILVSFLLALLLFYFTYSSRFLFSSYSLSSYSLLFYLVHLS